MKKNITPITFAELRNFESNSIVLTGLLLGDEDLPALDNFLHEGTGLFPEGLNVVEVRHLSDNVLGDEGRSDIVVIFDGEGFPNPMVRLQLRMAGWGVMWTEDFLYNYAKDYISGEAV